MIINYAVIILACIGLALSFYSYTLENRIKKNATTDGNNGYKPACDISDRISCSKPILSPYGSLFTTSNSTIGMIFYTAVLIFALLGMNTIVFGLSLLACIASLVFAFILFTKIQVICPICVSIYIVNALLLWASWSSLI